MVTGRIERGKVKSWRRSRNRWLPRNPKDSRHRRRNVQEALDEGLAGDRWIAASRHRERGCSAASCSKGGSITPTPSSRPNFTFSTKKKVDGTRDSSRDIVRNFISGQRTCLECPANKRHRDGDAGRHVNLVIELITPVAMEKGLRFAIREGGHGVGTGTRL